MGRIKRFIPIGPKKDTNRDPSSHFEDQRQLSCGLGKLKASLSQEFFRASRGIEGCLDQAAL